MNYKKDQLTAIVELAKKDGVNNLLAQDLLVFHEFYEAWVRAESTRGCYSCSEVHDCRCPASRGNGACACGREDLNRLEEIISP